MKTIKEWLKEYLTKEEYEKAEKYKNKKRWNSKEDDFYNSLIHAFIWKFTDEGSDYWIDILLRDIPDIEVKQKDSIVDEVRKDLLERSELGIKKYNTTLDREDLSILDWHQNHYEELLDAALYTKKIIKELKNKY